MSTLIRTGFFLAILICLASCDGRESDPSAAKDQEPETIATEGEAAIVEAALGGQLARVRKILHAGADVNLPRHDGITALHGAAMNGNKDIVALLLAKGAKLNTKENLNGFTPLHWAVFKGDAEIVELLLECGADPTITDDDDSTPLDLARAMQASTKLENYSIIALMLQARMEASAKSANGTIAILVDALDVEAGPEFGSIARQLVSEGVGAVPALVRTIKDSQENQRKRVNAVFVLAKIGPVSEEVAETFAWILSARTFDDRKADNLGFVAESRISSPKIALALATSISDSRAEVRANALSAAIATGFADDLKQVDLRALLNDADERVRVNAALTVGALRAPDDATVEALRWTASHDDVPLVRKAAVQSLELLVQR